MATQSISTTKDETDLTNRNSTEKWSGYAPEFRSILRIVASFLFIQFGF